MKDRIAVLIPCYNESRTIEKVVTDFRRVLPEATVYVYDNKTVEVEFKFDDLLKKATEKFVQRGNDDEADEK